MSARTTVISHFYNEEYFLPWWLTHHVPLFDDGILIDYRSTDRSREIISRLAPHWTVIPSQNIEFSARAVDDEVMQIEQAVSGWTMALNTTEFLLGDLRTFLSSERASGIGFRIPAQTMVDKRPSRRPSEGRSLISQKPWGVSGAVWRKHVERAPRTSELDLNTPYDPTGRARLLHRADNGQYWLGRHGWDIEPTPEVTELRVGWFSLSPWTAETRARKVHVKDKIPEADRAAGYGFQHFAKIEQMDTRHDFWALIASKPVGVTNLSRSRR